MFPRELRTSWPLIAILIIITITVSGILVVDFRSVQALYLSVLNKSSIPASRTSDEPVRDIGNMSLWQSFSQYTHDKQALPAPYNVPLYVEKNGNLYADIGSNQNLLPSYVSTSTLEIYLFNDSYARDSSHVYFEGEEIAGADPNTFVPVGNGRIYAKDASNVYCAIGPFDMQALPDSDPTSFTIRFDLFNTGAGYSQELIYASTISHVYRGCVLVGGADPATFEISGYFNGKVEDASSIFFDGTFGELAPPNNR